MFGKLGLTLKVIFKGSIYEILINSNTANS